MNRLAILGAGGHGKVIADAAVLSGWTPVFFDDAWPTLRGVGPWEVNGDSDALLSAGTEFDSAVVAIGVNSIRLARQRALEEAGVPMATVYHPSAVISPFAEVGQGSVILAGAILNAFAVVGRGCILNTGSTVDHDCRLADGVHVSPGANLGGNVCIGEATSVGIGAAIKPGVTIGGQSVVGAGAAVIGDVPDHTTVAGVPAKVLLLETTFDSRK